MTRLGQFSWSKIRALTPDWLSLRRGPSPIAARVFQRHQSQVTRDLFATLKPIRSLHAQHERECSQGTPPGVCHQPLRLGTFLGLPLDGLRQLGNRRVQSVQQLQPIPPLPAGPWS
jgi:hypothetical protein